MPDNYCDGFAVAIDEKGKEIKETLRALNCRHPAWKMLIVGIPGILGDFGWECTKCGKILQGLNPFKDEENSEVKHE
jgi:hypothetical protein